MRHWRVAFGNHSAEVTTNGCLDQCFFSSRSVGSILAGDICPVLANSLAVGHIAGMDMRSTIKVSLGQLAEAASANW